MESKSLLSVSKISVMSAIFLAIGLHATVAVGESANARGAEGAPAGGASRSGSGPVIRSGECALVGSMFKRLGEGGRFSVVPLDQARAEGSGCPRLRNYEDVERAYQESARVAQNPPACASLKLEEIVPGIVCRTNLNGRFERYQNQNGELGWRDLGSNGKIWFDRTFRGLNQDEAKEFCQAQNLNLPSAGEALAASSRGLQEVSSRFRDFTLQTSSNTAFEGPDRGGESRVYVGREGIIGTVPRATRHGHAMCVSSSNSVQ